MKTKKELSEMTREELGQELMKMPEQARRLQNKKYLKICTILIPFNVLRTMNFI
jgi:hypothetical protein